MIQPGYLLLSSVPGRPGHVTVASAGDMPDPPTPGLLWAARFNDAETALSHAHNRLSRKLVDIDTHLYKVSPARAIGALDGAYLSHRRAYLDPTLSDAVKAEIDDWSAYYQRRHRWTDKLIRGVGYLFVAYLLFVFLYVF
ncbi:hypothetical protein Q4485_03525 [Granulosicoccaceae sp. 1_MG-2023]|nr:hypothetical protein [Granulosicoccaceae sp. 1_MG-2023]